MELGEKQDHATAAKSGDAYEARGRPEKRDSRNKKWRNRSRSGSQDLGSPVGNARKKVTRKHTVLHGRKVLKVKRVQKRL